jgi:hypothetical protein
MPSGDNELWDRGRPSQPGDNAGSIARQTVCKWRSHRESRRERAKYIGRARAQQTGRKGTCRVRFERWRPR